MNAQLASGNSNENKRTILFAAIFLVVAILGLTYVKWWPYTFKALKAASEHTIGSSILTGGAESAPDPSWGAAWDYALAYYNAVWKAVILGILLGSLIQVLIPTQWLIDKLGKHTFKSTALGGIASLPGMMCTCCAAPLAVGMRKKQVSVGAALAFWIGNPAINPATLIFMAFVLSWEFTMLRVVFGLLLTFGISYLANRFMPAAVTSPVPVHTDGKPVPQESLPFWNRWFKQVWSMLLNIVPAYILSVLLLGAFRAWMFPEIGEAAASSILIIILFAVVGMLFVIPTAAEIPIIQTMMSFGLGAGPAAALLITLPSVSLPSFMMLSKTFPLRVLVFVASSTVLLGVLCGIAGAIIIQ